MSPRRAFILARHLYRVWTGGQLRFRLETFGLYYPSEPYTRRWWQVSPATARLLLSRVGAYARWVEQMEDIERRGTLGAGVQRQRRIRKWHDS